MTDNEAPIADGELHAFVDGQLDTARVAAVLLYLQAYPDAAVRVAQWHAQRLQLRRMHRAADPGDTPAVLTDTVLRSQRRSRWSPWGQAIAALLLVAAGVAGGRLWLAPASPPAAIVAAAPPQFVRDAAAAYAVFSPEVRHPVEVPADQEAHLVQWLSRRLGRPLTAPLLQAHGFQLLGGRLLPGEPLPTDAGATASTAVGKPAATPAVLDPATARSPSLPRAQFMYEDARGRRVTLYVAVFPENGAPHETAFRSVKAGNSESFYWIENGYGYALSGDMAGPELQTLAGDVYDQLYPR
jgi:anti-sigma factor RsiW